MGVTPANQLRSEPEDFGSAVGFTLKSDTLHQNIEMNIQMRENLPMLEQNSHMLFLLVDNTRKLAV